MQNGSNYSNVTLTAYEIVARQSLYMLSVTAAGPAQVFLCVSFIGFFSGFVVFATILRTKALHKKNYVLIACVAFADIQFACALMILGVRRITAFENKVPMVFTQYQCLLEEIPRVFAIGSINGLFLTCAVDRFIAVAKPHWYNSSYPKWLFVSIIILNYARISMEICIFFTGASKDVLLPICAYTFATSAAILENSTLRNNILLASICVVYFATIGTVYVRLGRARKRNANVKEVRNQMQTKVVWTLAVMLGGYMFTIGAGAVMYRFTYAQSIEVQLKYGALAWTFQEGSALCNLVILYVKNKDFRAGAYGTFCFWKPNAIGPTASTRGASTIVRNMADDQRKNSSFRSASQVGEGGWKKTASEQETKF